LGHKYARGHALVVGGAAMTGAARLASKAALRVGAGLVTLLCPNEVFAIQAGALDSVIVEAFADESQFSAALVDSRRDAMLLGPGNGRGAETAPHVLAALASAKAHPERSFVLDADALSIFADNPAALFAHLTPRCLLTPHAGEFARLFPDLADYQATSKVAATRAASARCGAVILLKGADTVIAAPDGRAAINANAPPDLATAGAGDVLAGLCTGLLAQGLSAFDAACAAVWLHGDAAAAHGTGLIADDIIVALPGALGRLKAMAFTAP
jgi:NAD(P)H-hydrate epimerase